MTKTQDSIKAWEKGAHERHVYLYRHCRLCKAQAKETGQPLSSDPTKA